MARLLRYTFAFALFCAASLLIGYFLVLPSLGRSAPATSIAGLAGDARRGSYLATAAGCLTCHTDYKKKGKLLAGGAALKTLFGTFYGPNITPDKEHGIGTWSGAQFARALSTGVSPDGRHYFPSFPYTSYARMKPQDIVDIKRYLDTVAPASQPSRPHDLQWPFSDRKAIGAWKTLNFIPARDGDMGRGAYLVNVLGHCGECHTQRGLLGGKTGLPLAGNTSGPGGTKVPGLRDLANSGKPWTLDNVKLSLQVGMKPNGDFLGGTMAEVIEHSTSKLSDHDREAIADFLLSLR